MNKIELIKALREGSGYCAGASLWTCKQAVEQSDGTHDSALRILNKLLQQGRVGSDCGTGPGQIFSYMHN